MTYKLPDLDSLQRVAAIDDAPSDAFSKLLKKHKISTAEYARIRELIGRAPTMAELGVFSAMWSEHCSYKSSRVHLKRFPTTGPNVVVGPGENAGVVRLSGKLCLAFKMESHNHPSYIEPYQGAATGVGGILRDVFCMGARPIANLNALRFGDRRHPRTAHLVANVVKGIGDYGNCIGVPTVAGNVSFDRSYDGNCLVNAMTVGVIHEDRIFKGYATGQGNLVVYIGSKTGRDGIHGATMASDSFGAGETNERSTVQVGDPFTEKLLLEVTLEVLEKGLVVGLQDMGAAGLTSSAFEMAGRAGNGLFMDLSQVPVRTTAMTAYELLLSESQERMLMVIEPKSWPALKAVLDRWQLAGTIIGEVTNTGRVQVQHEGRLEVDLPVGPITDDAPKYERPMAARPTPAPHAAEAFDLLATEHVTARGAEELLLAALQDTGDKQPIYDQYDQHIQVRTVHGPSHQGAAVLWVRSDWADASEPYLGVATAASCNERYTRVDPRLGAAHAVLKSARALAAAGATSLAITDCLNYGNPEVPEVMGDFSAGVDGISDACRELSVPVVSGNVSLYNTTDGQSIAPTPMIGIVGKIVDVRSSAPAIATAPGRLFLLVGRNVTPRFGGSLVAKHLGLDVRGGAIPAIDWAAEREAISALVQATAKGQLLAARDVGDGGVATTAVKMALGGNLSAQLDLTTLEASWGDPLKRLFGEVSGAYLLMLKDENDADKLRAGLARNQLVEVGSLRASGVLTLGAWTIPVPQAQRAHDGSLRG